MIKNQGVSLSELIIAIAILAILSAVPNPTHNTPQEKNAISKSTTTATSNSAPKSTIQPNAKSGE